jgi:hypothetical protein
MPRCGKLDLIVFIRSNDILWGLSGVNVFEFTVLQELVSSATNIPLGTYYHVANSLHYYSEFQKRFDIMRTGNRFDVYDHVLPPYVAPLYPLAAYDSVLKEFFLVNDALINGRLFREVFENKDVDSILSAPSFFSDMCLVVFMADLLHPESRMDGRWSDAVADVKTLVRLLHDGALCVAATEWLFRVHFKGRPDIVNLSKCAAAYDFVMGIL